MITDKNLQNAKAEAKPRRIQIGDNAYLEISPKGRKTWRMRYRRPDTGKEAILTIGRYCDEDKTNAQGQKNQGGVQTAWMQQG